MRFTKHHNFRKKYKKFATDMWNFFLSKTGAFLIGITAIILGSYQFYINKPILKYQAFMHNVVSSNNLDEIKIKVNEKEYKDLFKTTLVLTNVGQQALSGGDVSKIGHDPIRVVLPKDAKVISYLIDNNLTSPAVTAKLIPYKDSLIIGFDYLNPANQIGIDILHENENQGFVIKGSAVNVNNISKEWNEQQIRFWSVTVLSVLYFIFLVYYLYNRRKRRHSLLKI